jgi:hypothetical protein
METLLTTLHVIGSEYHGTHNRRAARSIDTEGKQIESLSESVTISKQQLQNTVQDRDGSWRIRMNHELRELIGNADTIAFINRIRIAWLGHVMGMDEKRIPETLLEWKPTGRRIRGRPRKRWIENIEKDIQS